METYHTRLDPRKTEVLDFTKTYGQLAAMTEFDLRSIVRFRAWLKEVTGDENFGLRPLLKLDGDQTLGDQVLASMLQSMFAFKAEVDRLRAENQQLRARLQPRRSLEHRKALAILEACQP